jgi:hypothetical protein
MRSMTWHVRAVAAKMTIASEVVMENGFIL